MKEGTGGDPFSEDADVDDLNQDEPDGDDGMATTTDVTGDISDTSPEQSDQETVDEDGLDNEGLPWAVERSSVKSEREMVQFYLRSFVQERESEFQHEVEAETGYDTYLTDVREAAYLVAMNHPEEVAQLLDDWGCEYA